MMRRAILAALACMTLAVPARTDAVVKVYENGEQSLSVGARIQMQYRSLSPEGEDAEDGIFFRRLRPDLRGSVTEHWYGKIQFDFGSTFNENEVALKDVYFGYTGVDWAQLEIRIGNTKHAFSREFLASSNRQQQVERMFVGNRNFGMLDRVLGVMAQGKSNSGKLSFIAGAGGANHDPDARRMDFDTPVNDEDDWNEGWAVSGRLDYHPMGYLKFDQADFNSESFKATLGASAYGWWNDGDRNTYTDGDGSSKDDGKADLKEAYGLEVSGGLRGEGVSVDAQYQRVSGKTEARGFTGGIYRNGETDLDIASFKTGYMVVRNRLELNAAWDMLDATNYQDAWMRYWFGANWYLNKHNLKFQLNYQLNRNWAGVRDEHADQVLVQGQFVF
jgi:hypothetical protein